MSPFWGGLFFDLVDAPSARSLTDFYYYGHNKFT